ncbi:hypothetical protein FH972_009499 [Carpinus fangiana]|uniref:Chorismate mutase n=1 Tax=Carpinus fangiana TaxID=176857 RepID=A0A660KSD2_9ROSI|nr:hypothetical protein FH972_009499 [Carpinus fangiana]
MDTAIDLSNPSAALDLNNIRFQLIRLEDTITFHLIERVQFPLNPTVYTTGAIPGLHPTFPTKGGSTSEGSLSLLDWNLREQERLQSLIRRYQSPDEYPFFPDALQTPILPPIQYPRILHPNDVNINAKLKEKYTNEIMPAACAQYGRPERPEAQENFGSAVTCDVMCLQALSRRIHFGKFVAESKFQKETDRFVALIKAEDRIGIDAAITDAKVEQKVLERLRLKANTYGKDPAGLAEETPVKVNADAVVSMYKDYVIPLTKEVEVEYLMQRLNNTQWE